MKATPLIVSFCCLQFAAGLVDLAAEESLKAPDVERVATAEALVDALAREDFAGAAALFSPTLRRAMPEARLRELWASMMRQAGAFRARGGSRTETSGTTHVVFVMTEFREFVLEAKVVFNADGEVSGFHFLPPPKTAIAPRSGWRMASSAC